MEEALRELTSIVKIHSEATNNNFAWAEIECAEEALKKAKESTNPLRARVDELEELLTEIDKFVFFHATTTAGVKKGILSEMVLFEKKIKKLLHT